MLMLKSSYDANYCSGTDGCPDSYNHGHRFVLHD